MHGQIVKFDEDLGYGVIHADDGSRFRFTKDEVVNPNGKLIGYDVDFLLDTRRAQEIFLMYGTPFDAFGTNNS